MTLDFRAKDAVILVTGDGMGQTDQELGHKLLKTYFHLLGEAEIHPGAICFYAAGVKMAVDGSPVLEELKVLENAGVPIILCGTCLNHYQLGEKIAVGIQGGMTDIIEAQFRADKVITL